MLQYSNQIMINIHIFIPNMLEFKHLNVTQLFQVFGSCVSAFDLFTLNVYGFDIGLRENCFNY